MAKVTFNIPSLWADHHTLAVRQLLGNISGVQNITVSALYRDVVVEHDPDAVGADTIASALEDAGYRIGEALSLPSHPERIDDSSDWFQIQERITETDMRDLIMSGDHRKY